MVKFFLASIAVICSVGAGCARSPSGTLVVPSTPANAFTFSWADARAEVSFSNGVTVRRCGEGDAPIVCAFTGTDPRGQMELNTYDTSHDETVLTLEERIADYYANIGADRRTCGAGFAVNTSTPRKMTVAGREGLKAELTVRDKAGRMVEYYALYFAERGKQLSVFTISAYETGGCLSSEVPYTTIKNFETYAREPFEQVVGRSSVP